MVDPKRSLDSTCRLLFRQNGASADRQVRGNAKDPQLSPLTPKLLCQNEDEKVLQIHIDVEDDPESWGQPDLPVSPPLEAPPKIVIWKEGPTEQPMNEMHRGWRAAIQARERAENWKYVVDESAIERAFQQPPRALETEEEVSTDPVT